VTAGSAIQDQRAEQVASIIFDAIRDKVATKADMGLLRAEVIGIRSVTTGVQDEIALLAHKADVGNVSAEAARLRDEIAHLRGAVQAMEKHVNARIERAEHRLLMRLGALIVVVVGALIAVVVGALFAAPHYWPLHG
jgi:CHASE3 domain sensor protein